MKLVVSLTVCLLFVLQARADVQLELVTFNVRWFGVTVNDPRSPNPTPIDPQVRLNQIKSMTDFMKKVVKPQGLIVFEEVVDLNLLNTILPAHWNCAGYRHPNPHHQHIAICAAPQFKISKVPYDSNTTIEQVATDNIWSRPAVRIDISNRLGRPFLRVVGLHLKSAPNFSDERYRQMTVIAQDLRQGGKVPTLLVGDANSYSAQQTGRPQSDVERMTRALKAVDTSFQHLEHQEMYTFRSPRFQSQFDQIFFNSGVKPLRGPDVFDVCNNDGLGSGYLNFKYYYANVSDHCPVKTVLQIKGI